MSGPLRWLCILPFAALSSAALAQTSGAIGSVTPSATPSATGEIRGLGLPSVPNNRLAPLPSSVAPTPSLTGTTTVPAVGGATAMPPTPPSPSAAPGVTLELAPPAPASAPGTPNTVRTCPPGITFC